MQLGISGLSFAIDGQRLLDNIHMHADTGETIGLVGPNGSGKSTLLKNICCIHHADSGQITLDDADVFELSNKALARMLGVVGQETPARFEFTVHQIIRMGRAPHKGLFSTDNRADEAMVDNALATVGMTGYEQRSITSLSGGETQRVMLARALAQDASLLLLDEPTNHLDIRHQLQLLDLVRSLETTVVAALHDLNLAANYCDRIQVIDHGRIIASGRPEDVFTYDLLRDVFGVHTHIARHPATDKIHITYLASTEPASSAGATTSHDADISVEPQRQSEYPKAFAS